MLKEENKFKDSTLFEGMLSIRALLAAQKTGVSDRRILRVLFSQSRKEKLSREIAFLRHEGERQGFSVEEVTPEQLDKMTVGSTHGGLVAECSARTLPSLTDSQAKIKKNGFYVMIEGIEDPYNFGYALRSLYALGVDGILLPERNWLSAAGVVTRASAGASERFPVFLTTAAEAISVFRAQGYRIVCADVNTDDTLEHTSLPYPILLIVGGEKRDISRALLSEADVTVKISYGRDFPESLSAASAATILAYEIAKQNRPALPKRSTPEK